MQTGPKVFGQWHALYLCIWTRWHWILTNQDVTEVQTISLTKQFMQYLNKSAYKGHCNCQLNPEHQHHWHLRLIQPELWINIDHYEKSKSGKIISSLTFSFIVTMSRHVCHHMAETAAKLCSKQQYDSLVCVRACNAERRADSEER